MDSVQQNNRRIAKNTAFLYVRMFISMAVSLYTSRVILKTLGVEDYGIYSIVGGVVAMFDFINSTMSGATARFLTFELGKENQYKLNKTFNASFWMHVIIAAIILILSETIGLWFLNHKMEIPENRLFAANIVFQFSIITTMVSITQVPYNSAIIAHEKMDIYAYVEMVNVFLRLGILYLLVLINVDKLILYSFLVLAVSSGTMMFYRYYCKKKFEECHIRFEWDKEILKPMVKFSAWDFYGNMAVSARTEGVAILINLFFGPVMNAASGIAMSIQGVVLKFANSINTAVRPQIIKYYAQNNFKQMESLINNSSKITLLIMILIVVPLAGEIDYVFHLWLVDVPPFATTFCIFTLLFNLFANTSFLVNTGNHAAGKIIRPSVINGSLYLLVIPMTYVAFKFGCAVWVPYLFNLIAVFLGLLSNAYSLHKNVPSYSVFSFIKQVLVPSVIVFLLGTFVILLVKKWIEPSFGRLIVSTILSVASMSIFAWFVVLPYSLKTNIINRFKKIICKKV